MSSGQLIEKVTAAIQNLQTTEPAKKNSHAALTKKTLSRMLAVQLLYQVHFLNDIHSLQTILQQDATQREKMLSQMIESFCHDGLSEHCFSINDFHKAISNKFILELLEKYLSEYTVLAKDLQTFLTDNQSFYTLQIMIKNIVLLGIAELKYFPDTPAKVIINEYLDIAGCFLEKRQINLINGILDNANKHLRVNEIKTNQ